jgi:hypothetical protein
MNKFDHIAMVSDQRHQELLKEAEKYRMLKAAFKDQPAKLNNVTRLLAFVGGKLASIGYSMETRYGAQAESQTYLAPQTNPGGCT